MMTKGYAKSPKTIGQMIHKGFTSHHKRRSKKFKGVPPSKQAGQQLVNADAHEAEENNL